MNIGMTQRKALFEEAEELLEKWKHPDPYRPPTAPGGIFLRSYAQNNSYH